MAGDGRHPAARARTVGAARARTVGAARSAEVPASQAGVPPPTGPAGRHARLPETDRGGAPRPPRAVSLGAAGPPPRAAKARVAGPHRVAGLPGRRREGSAAALRAAALRRAATSAAPGSQPILGHGGPPRVTRGEARGLPAKGRPRVQAAATGPRGRPAARPATGAQPTAAEATPAKAPGQATAAQVPAARRARARLRRAVTKRPIRPGCTFLIRSAPTSSTRNRGPS